MSFATTPWSPSCCDFQASAIGVAFRVGRIFVNVGGEQECFQQVIESAPGDGTGLDDLDVAAPFGRQQSVRGKVLKRFDFRRHRARSILFSATTIGTSAALAWLIASSVCGITPSSAATTSTAMSVTFAPRARISVKASWPGVSTNANLRPPFSML